MFYNRKITCPPEMHHAVERNAQLARAIGLQVDPLEFPMALTEAETARAMEKLAPLEGQPFTAILPGTRWASKQWPVANFAELLDQLDGPSVLLGAPDETHLGEQIRQATSAQPLDLIGRTSLRELVAILSRAGRIVCCDSGPMHIAAALGRPLVALFGPTYAERTGPFSEAAVVLQRPLPCRPCRKRVCPLGHQDCLRQLSGALVAERVREQLPLPASGETAIDASPANPR